MNGLRGILVRILPVQPPLRPLMGRLDTFQRVSASNGTKGSAKTTSVSTSTRFHLQSEHQAKAPGDGRRLEASRLRPAKGFANFGSKVIVTEVINANSRMKGSRESPVLQHQQGTIRVIPLAVEAVAPEGRRAKAQKDPGAQEAKVPREENPPRVVSPQRAVVLTSMLASVAQACPIFPCCPAVRFEEHVEVNQIPSYGLMHAINNSNRKYEKVFPIDHNFHFDPRDRQDAALSASMLAGAVSRALSGLRSICKYECDTEFGCDYCIPKGMTATPAASSSQVKGSITIPVDWIADTGSAQDFFDRQSCARQIWVLFG